MDYIWIKVRRSLRSSNSLQMILLSICVHSIISILMIYFHLNCFLDQESRYQPNGLSRKSGGFSLARRRLQINLISSSAIHSNDELPDHGWWSFGSKWRQDVECFPQKWILCTKVLSTECNEIRPSSNLYQYLSIRSDTLLQSIEISLQSIEISLRSKSGIVGLKESKIEPFYGLETLIKLNNGSSEKVRIEFPTESNEWNRRISSYSSPPGTRISDILILLSCHGYIGTFSFADIEIIPKPDRKEWTSRDDLIDTMNHVLEPEHGTMNQEPRIDKINLEPEIDTMNQVLEPGVECEIEEVVVIPSNGSSIKDTSMITLVSHVFFDEISILDWSLGTWKDSLVSLFILVPVTRSVTRFNNKLDDWQKTHIHNKLSLLNLLPGSKVTIVNFYQDDIVSKLYQNRHFSLNKIRNIALKDISTEFVLLIDGHFQPSPDFVSKAMADVSKAMADVSKVTKDVSKVTKDGNGKIDKRTAYVIPIFYYHQNGSNVSKDSSVPNVSESPRTKEELIEKMLKSVPDQMKAYDRMRSQSRTDYWKWYHLKDPFPVHGFSDNSLLLHKQEIPSFFQGFKTDSFDQITFMTELLLKNYTFLVLPNVWLLHSGQKKNSNSVDTSSFDTLSFDTFKEDVIKRFKHLIQLKKRYSNNNN